MTTRPGMFVAFEGVDGAGKSSQLRAAAQALRQRGENVVETREPGGSPGAEQIRALLVTGAVGRWSAETELLLFTAARRDHLERTIEPALAAGAVVLCDRYVDSTRAYQAGARGARSEQVEALHALMIGREPDLVLIYDLAPEIARKRAGSVSEDRYERFGLAFQRQLRDAYRALAEAAPERRRLIDADRPVETVLAETLGAVDAALAAARR